MYPWIFPRFRVAISMRTIALAVLAVLLCSSCANRAQGSQHLCPVPYTVPVGSTVYLHAYGSQEAAMVLEGWLSQRGYKLTTKASSQMALSSTTGTTQNGVNLQTDTRSSGASYRVELEHGTTGMTYKVIRLSDGVTMEYFTDFDTATVRPPLYWIQQAQRLMARSFPGSQPASGAATYGNGPTPRPVFKR